MVQYWTQKAFETKEGRAAGIAESSIQILNNYQSNNTAKCVLFNQAWTHFKY